MRALALITLALTVPYAAHAAGKEKDLRRASSAGHHTISFCARDSPTESGLPGHAFVVFRKDAGGEQSLLSVGLAPAGAKNAVKALTFSTVPGYLAKENMSVENCLHLLVSKDQYERAFSSTGIPLLRTLGLYDEKLGASATYRLLSNDCVSFAQDIASSLKPDLVVPDRLSPPSLTPHKYIDALKAAN